MNKPKELTNLEAANKAYFAVQRDLFEDSFKSQPWDLKHRERCQKILAAFDAMFSTLYE